MAGAMMHADEADIHVGAEGLLGVAGLFGGRWPMSSLSRPRPRLGEEVSRLSPMLPAQPPSVPHPFWHPTSPSHPRNGTA